MSEKHSEDEKKALSIRLKKIIGQLTAVEKMIETDRECPEILNQLVSARKAIKSLSEKLIRQHLHHCLEEAQQGEGKRKLREFLTVLERYVD